MTTLITGASGFVGSAVCRHLLAAGHEVRALVRAGSDRGNLEGLPLEIVTGDLTDAASLRRAAQGCDTLFHVAADYRLWAPDPRELYRVNVDGSRALMQAALDAGIGRIVYTSSVAVLGIRADRTPADEATPVTVDDMIGHYKRSKFLAEAAVRELIEQHGAPVVIVNPSTPVGPRDIKPTPTGRIILDMMRRKMPAYVDTGLNVAHVDDVAAGHLLALTRGRIGERYVLGGEDLSLREILHAVAELAGVPAPKVKLPHGFVLPIAWISERIAALTGREPQATVDGVRMARKYMWFSSAKAMQELGYAPRPARAGLADAVQWFRAAGRA